MFKFFRRDSATYQSLAASHLDRLHAYARRRVQSDADADDLGQETLIRGWQRFDQLRDVTAMRSWFYRILTTLWAEQYRTRRRRMELVPITRLEAHHDEMIASMEPGPLQALLARQTGEAVHAALAALPQDYAAAVELHDIEGFRYREIAEITGVPIGTVMSRIARGRRLLAGQLREWTKSEPARARTAEKKT